MADAFDDRGLADAGLADQHGVVLRAACEHLDHAADLFIATDDGIDLVGSCGCSDVARVLLERLKLVFGVRVDDPLCAANFLDRARELVAIECVLFEHLGNVVAGRDCGEQDVLDR